jgi:hypothetical protein
MAISYSCLRKHGGWLLIGFPLFLLMALTSQSASASADAKVFPVQGLFWDETQTKAIDQRFMKSIDMPKMSLQIKESLEGAFAGRTGDLTQNTAANTFAVSLHLTRMAVYQARKADGNIEIRTPVTGSIYFTNVITGEILFTVTSTNAANALVPAKSLEGKGLDDVADRLYTSSLLALVGQLCKKANESFQPLKIEVSVTGIQNGLFLLSGGYKQGIQSGDNLEDDQSSIIRILYAGPDYSVAQVVLADEVKSGSTFHKFIVGKIDGRLRPRSTVVVDKVAEGFTPEYVAQLFSEELGDKAPLTMVQVNRNFSTLLKTVVQKASLTTSSTAQRDTPDLIIRLRVSDPIVFETKTNLAFKTVRGFEANAFVEIIDTTGRVLFTASGHDFQKIDVTNGLDLDPKARREIAVKNVLLTLAQEMAKLAEAKVDSASVVKAGSDGNFVATQGKVFAEKQSGYLLRSSNFNVAGKSQKVLFPLYEATAEKRIGNETRVAAILPLGKEKQGVAIGDIFEVIQMGITPKTAVAFGLCSDTESLGTVKTPDFESLVSVSVGKAMPGMYYVPEIQKTADNNINGLTGFREKIKWDIPSINSCLQPVQRVDITGDLCADQCQKLVTARYTIRVKTGEAIGAKVGLESKFKTTGYEKTTSEQAVSSLVQSDLVDEAQKLLSGIAGKLLLIPTN